MFDVIVVGGSYAGISAAMQLARARKRVVVIDAGTRRNRAATSAHGFFGQDGRDPAQIAAKGREEVLAYPTATWMETTATHATKLGDDGFSVEVSSGERFEARRLVLALGVTDELPDIPGIRERWGRSVFHCPYCHGYELDGGRIGVLATSPMSIHHARLLPDWGEVTYFTRGEHEPSDEDRMALAHRNVNIERAPVTGIEGGDHDVAVRLSDGRVLSFAGLFVLSTTHAGSPLAAQLGCAMEEGPLGSFVQVDAMKETTVSGVFACGDVAVPAGAIAFAVADGARAGVSTHQSLIFR